MKTPAKSRRRAPDEGAPGDVRPPEGKRARNKREKLGRIVTVARRLFSEQGYADTTTQQIAVAAEIGAGTLFLYAKSKEDLLLLVFTAEMLPLVERTFADIDAGEPLPTQVLALFARFIDYHAGDVPLARQLIREITFLRHRERMAELRVLTHAIVGKLRLMLERAAARHEVAAGTDLELLANCLFSIYYQQLQTWLSGFVTRRRFERSLAAMVRLVLDGARDPSARR